MGAATRFSRVDCDYFRCAPTDGRGYQILGWVAILLAAPLKVRCLLEFFLADELTANHLAVV